MSNFDQREQKVERQLNVGELILKSLNINYPIEQVVFAELIGAIVIQIGIAFMGFASNFLIGLIFLYAPLCICSPFLFGFNAVYGFTIGITKKDNRIVILSVISGLLSVAPLALYFLYGILSSIL